MSFGVITPFFGVNYVNFLCTNMSVEIYAIIYAKLSFDLILSTFSSFLGKVNQKK
jgi:hypothetical protein